MVKSKMIGSGLDGEKAVNAKCDEINGHVCNVINNIISFADENSYELKIYEENTHIETDRFPRARFYWTCGLEQLFKMFLVGPLICIPRIRKAGYRFWVDLETPISKYRFTFATRNLDNRLVMYEFCMSAEEILYGEFYEHCKEDISKAIKKELNSQKETNEK